MADMVELELQYLGTTEVAILVRDGDEDGDPEAWLPLSQIEVLTEMRVGSVIKVEVPEWLAIEKGLV